MYEFLDVVASEVMSKPVTVAPDASLAEVEQLLEETGFNGVPVARGDALLGFVTTLDLLAAFRFGSDSTLPQLDEILRRPVSSVMGSQPEVVQPRTPLTRVIEKMLDTRNKSFPVVDPHGDRLVGVIAREDVMRALRRAEAGETSSATAVKGS